MVTTPEELAASIRSAWEADDCPPDDDLTAWTAYVNGCLADLAHSKGLHAYGTGLGRNKGEYLVDHCWSEPWTRMADYKGLRLAAEFEWNGSRGSLEEDIIKLADVRAPARLFVGTLQAGLWKTVEDIANDVSALMKAHELDDRQWLVLALAPKSKTVDGGHLRIWKITRAGASELIPGQ